jgi:hypothetical protein
MAGRAPGGLARVARRLLAFSAVGISRPARRPNDSAHRHGPHQNHDQDGDQDQHADTHRVPAAAAR